MKWSMKLERELIQIARSNFGVEKIAIKLGVTPKAVIQAGRRLGIYFRPLKLKQGRHRKK